MSKTLIRKLIINGLLLAGIVGVLMIYSSTLSDLPERIYTPQQREFLIYNTGNNISQFAPNLNFLATYGPGAGPDLQKIMPNGESHVRADLKARYEDHQGVTVTVYDLDFHGEYLLVGPAVSAVEVELVFPFPSNLETLKDVRFTVDGDELPGVRYASDAISWRTTLQSGEMRKVDISYKASGAQNFTYGLPRNQRTAIDVVITVSGLTGSSIPTTSLPATRDSSSGDGETFTWNYVGLIANRDIQLFLPTRLGFAQRIAELQGDFRALAEIAPFLVGLFIASVAGLFLLSGLGVPLEGSLLAGLILAFFYPLLTFASGLIGILPAMPVAVVIVSGLLLGFLRLAAGWQKTWRSLSIVLLIFAGFFSLGVLTPWRGLLWTSGGLLLLLAMVWAYTHRPVPMPPVLPEHPEEPLKTAQADHVFCVHCGRELEDAHIFCPGCGHDARTICRCDKCAHQQYVPSEADPVYCVHCGNQFA